MIREIHSIYVIGSLRNRKIIGIAKKLRSYGYTVFDEWITPGPKADEYWRLYAKERGLTYEQALKNYAAQHIFEFDKSHIDRSDAVVMVMPCGKSGHMELGYAEGQGKKTFVLFDGEPKRWEVMYLFANDVAFNIKDLVKKMRAHGQA